MRRESAHVAGEEKEPFHHYEEIRASCHDSVLMVMPVALHRRAKVRAWRAMRHGESRLERKVRREGGREGESHDEYE